MKCFVLRCRATCKWWKRLLERPEFVFFVVVFFPLPLYLLSWRAPFIFARFCRRSHRVKSWAVLLPCWSVIFHLTDQCIHELSDINYLKLEQGKPIWFMTEASLILSGRARDCPWQVWNRWELGWRFISLYHSDRAFCTLTKLMGLSPPYKTAFRRNQTDYRWRAADDGSVSKAGYKPSFDLQNVFLAKQVGFQTASLWFFWIGFLNSRFSKTRAILTTYCKLALANQSYTFRQAEQQKQTK